MIENDLIYNFEDFRTLIKEKAKEGSYYFLYDDLYFEEIKKNEMITREVFTVAIRYTKAFNVIKYINFKVKDEYTTNEIVQLIEILRQYTKILLTIFNPKRKECFFIFISTKDDSKIENEVKKILRMEK